MTISIFDLFSIGIGPSSSHTVGPMKAAYEFVQLLKNKKHLFQVQRILIELYGSLALTGKGHGTDIAILNGLEGQWPRTIDPTHILQRTQEIVTQEKINLAGEHIIAFHITDILLHQKELLPLHTNGMCFSAFYSDASDAGVVKFLLTAGAMAILYKTNASISGAEVGCQGEVGVACSMAAAALTAVMGGSIDQIENAAEIAMEHHLGMTCDPIDGASANPLHRTQCPGCAVKAVNAAHLALVGDGHHYVSLDKVIATMRQTGIDMMSIYKETSLGGLAANIPEC